MKPPPAVLFDPLKIQEAVARIAEEIYLWVENRQVHRLKLVSVLEGAKPFTRDLVGLLKRLAPSMEVVVTEVRVQGTAGTALTQKREWIGALDSPENFKDAQVLLVDDLVDSGKTLAMLRNHLLGLGVKEVKTAVLLRKFGQASGPVDFCGFDLNLNRKDLAKKGLKDYWLFGYGMDLNGKFREVEHVGWVEIPEAEKAKNDLPRMNTD